MRTSLLLVVLACGAAGAPPGLRAQSAAPLVIQHAGVVDVRAGRVLEDRTVLVDGGRIATIGPADSVKPPSGARVLNARGKYLIPGLWDMHVHAAWPTVAPPFAALFVANGVTGVREMFGDMTIVRAWKAKYDSGAAWPRLIGSGHIVDGPRPIWPGSAVATTANDARRVVDSLHAAGADFIKVYNRLPRDAYVAVLLEAQRVGTYVVGHVPNAVTVAEASDLGQRSVEHLEGVLFDCSRDGDSIRAEARAASSDTALAQLRSARARNTQRALATQDATLCAALATRLARNGTWLVPTLTVLRSMASLDDDRFTADSRLRFMPPAVVTSWNWRADFRFRGRTAADWATARRQYRRLRTILGEMHRAGVPILAGTDVLNPFVFPGFSLHDELGLLVETGLSPAEALRAATLSPAIFFGTTDSLGTVETGRRADLVLLDANPLVDIGNTRTVRAVVLNGRFYDRDTLDRLLRAAERRRRR